MRKGQQPSVLACGNVGGRGDRRLVGGRADELPRIALPEHFGGERRVQRVTATMHHEMPEDGIADEREIANHVQDLVTDELVLEAERIEDALSLIHI